MKMMEDWQNEYPCLAKRALYIYENKHFFDCLFIVGGELEIQCHKLILAMGSPVFQAMFYGSNPEPSGPIQIPDIAPPVFQQVIEFIYGKELQIDSYKNAFDLYYGAKKYLLMFLEKECVEYLKNNLTTENVLYLYEFAKFHSEVELEKLCMMEIQVNAEKVIDDKSITCISEETLKSILDQSLMNIQSELVLFNAVENWAHRNLKGESSCSPLKKLRLLTLTVQEFAEGPAFSKYLTDSEKLSILLRICGAVETPMNNGFCEFRIKRKPANFRSVAKLEITDLNETLCDGSEWLTSVVKTDVAIDLLGVEVRLQVRDEADDFDYIENLMVKVGPAYSDEHFGEGVLSGLVKYDTTAEIMLNNVTTLLPHKEYAIHIFLCRSGNYPIGRHTNLSIDNQSVTLTFVSHTSWERAHPNNTTVLSSLIYTDSVEAS